MATRLYYQGRLMNTITPTSSFFSFNAPADLYKQENQMKCAIILRDGWVHNAGHDINDFEILTGDEEPVKFSKMTHQVGAS